MIEIDWTKCPDAESVPGRCSGAWVAKDSRVMVEGILDNADEYSAAEVAEMFELPVEQVRRILRFAYQAEITAIIGPAESPPSWSAEKQARLDTLVRKVRALREPEP